MTCTPDSLGRSHAPQAGVIVLIGLIYAWPLASQLTVAIPGGPNDRDAATMVWNVGWVHHVLTHGGDLLRSDDVLVPFGADLRLHTYGLLQGLIAAPFVCLLGIVGAYNLIVLATLLLNGGLTYVLVHRESGSRLAALAASVSLMLAGPVLAQIRVGRPTFASLWMVAAVLLALDSLLTRPTLFRAVVLGALLLGALLTDFQIVLFAAIWLAVYGTHRLVREVRSLPLLRVLLASGLAAAIFALPFRLIFYPAFGVAGYPRPLQDDVEVYSFSYWDYFTPDSIPNAYGYDLLAGATLAILALVLRRRGGSYVVWLLGAAICLLLALGPVLHPTDVPLPFGALGQWAPLAQFRTPSRLAQPAALGLAVVLGLVVSRLQSHWRIAPVVIGLAIAARVVFAIVHDPFEVQVYPQYALYTQIAADPERFTLVEIPFGVRSGLDRIGQGGEVLEYYQHIHGKPVLNAMVARLPTRVFESYAAHPALRFLSGEPTLDPPDVLARDLSDVLEWSNARYVLLHRSLSTTEEANEWQAFLDTHPALDKIGVERDLVLYRARR